MSGDLVQRRDHLCAAGFDQFRSEIAIAQDGHFRLPVGLGIKPVHGAQPRRCPAILSSGAITCAPPALTSSDRRSPSLKTGISGCPLGWGLSPFTAPNPEDVRRSCPAARSPVRRRL